MKYYEIHIRIFITSRQLRKLQQNKLSLVQKYLSTLWCKNKTNMQNIEYLLSPPKKHLLRCAAKNQLYFYKIISILIITTLNKKTLNNSFCSRLIYSYAEFEIVWKSNVLRTTILISVKFCQEAVQNVSLLKNGAIYYNIRDLSAQS